VLVSSMAPRISPERIRCACRRGCISCSNRRAARVDRALVLGMAGVAQVERPVPGEGLTVAARARGQHAVEHVHPALDRSDEIVGLADAHEVAGAVFGQLPGAKSSVANMASCPSPTASPPMA